MICALALVVTLASIHVPDRGFNQDNPGVGVECDAPTWALGAGTYRNSFRRETSYVVGAWLPWHWGGWSIGPAAGPATGYSVPVVGGLMLRYRSGGHAGVNVLVVPPAPHGGSVAVGAQITWRF